MSRAVGVALVLAATVCSPDARCRPDVGRLAAYEAPGPLPVARTTVTFADATRPTPPRAGFAGAATRTLVTEVWYPDAAPAALPLVVQSHGFSGIRTSQEYVARHLVSHGYVVAALDFPSSNGAAPGGPTVDDVVNQPGDVRVVIDGLLELAATPGHALAGRIDAARIGASGLSLGGLTTLLATYHRTLRDPRIRAAVALAAPSCFLTRRFFRPSRAPLLLLHGTADLIVPFERNAARAFRAGREHHQLLALDAGTHTGFSAFTAQLPPPGPHYDVVACAVLLAALDGALDDPANSPFLDAATPQSGISTDPRRCGAPCPADLVAAAADGGMSGARQQAIVRAATTVFFEAWLREDRGAKCLAQRGLAAAYPDVRLRGR